MPLSTKQVGRLFGDFTFIENPRQRGAIIPEATWVTANMVTVVLPIVSTVRCHRLIAAQLQAVWFEIAAQPDLRRLVDVADTKRFGGCYVPRHMSWNPNRGLSRHTWGIAMDVNPSQFPYQSHKRWPHAFAQVWVDHGFECGQNWVTCLDPMHFEAVKIMPKEDP